MRINNLSLPHPVLSSANDDVRGSYNVDLQVELGRQKILLKIKQNLFNKTLKGLIDSKKAVYTVEVNCHQTFYRKSFASSEDSYVIEIPSKDLRNKSIVNFYITAVQDIPDYQIDEANEDYGSFKFDVTKGDVLAYGGYANFFAAKDWQALMAVTSFMRVESYAKPEGPVQFVLTQSEVVIQMAENDYKRYREYEGARSLYPIFHASFVFAALMHALYNMQSSTDNQDADWYQVLDERIRSEDKFKGLSVSQVEDLPRIAQALLGYPIYRELLEIKSMYESAGQEE